MKKGNMTITQEEIGLKEHLNQIEKERTLNALIKSGWNKAIAGRDLKISRSQVHYLIKKHRLQEDLEKIVDEALKEAN